MNEPNPGNIPYRFIYVLLASAVLAILAFEYEPELLALFLALFFLALILSPFLASITFITYRFWEGLFTLLKVNRQSKHVINAQHDFFKSKFYFYSLLDERERDLFLRRVNYILVIKNFEAKAEVVITEEVKWMFAGSLVKLTFGLHHYELAWHENIHFFPDIFVYGIDQIEMKGLTYTQDKIVFSLNHFLEGIADPHDKVNLALHELAHALKVNHTRYNKVYFESIEPIKWLPEASRFEYQFAKWHNVAIKEFAKMQSNKYSGFLREYAATNMDEFWAVSIEYFFEAPIEFKQALPELYVATQKLLNQDMATRFQKAISREQNKVAH